MEEFLAELTGGAPVDDVFDLCLDHDLVADEGEAPFTHIAGLEPFTGLESLSLARHQLQSLQGLPPLAQLAQLNLRQNELADLAHFPALPQLQLLDLGLNELTSLTGMPALPQLRELHLSHNELKTVEGGGELPVLEALYLNGNRQLGSLKGLGKAPQLRRLNAFKTRLVEVKELAQLPEIVELGLTVVGEGLWQVIGQMPALRRLALDLKWYGEAITWPELKLEALELRGGAAVPSVTGWSRLPQLRELKVVDMAWSHLPDDFAALQHLNTVTILGTEVASFQPLMELPQLARVTLGKGPINPDALRELEQLRPEIVVEIA